MACQLMSTSSSSMTAQENLLAIESVLAADGLRARAGDLGRRGAQQILERDFAVILRRRRDARAWTASSSRRSSSSASARVTRRSSSSPPAGSDMGFIYRGYSVGAVDYLTKPLDADVLRAKVAIFVELFRKDRGSRAGGGAARPSARARAELPRSGPRASSAIATSPRRSRRSCGPRTPDGAITYFNHRWYEYTGQTLGRSSSGWGWTRRSLPRMPSAVAQRWRDGLATGSSVFELECRLAAPRRRARGGTSVARSPSSTTTVASSGGSARSPTATTSSARAMPPSRRSTRATSSCRSRRTSCARRSRRSSSGCRASGDLAAAASTAVGASSTRRCARARRLDRARRQLARRLADHERPARRCSASASISSRPRASSSSGSPRSPRPRASTLAGPCRRAGRTACWDRAARRADHPEPARQRDQVRAERAGRGHGRRATTTPRRSPCATTGRASRPPISSGSSGRSSARCSPRNYGGLGLGLTSRAQNAVAHGGIDDVATRRGGDVHRRVTRWAIGREPLLTIDVCGRGQKLTLRRGMLRSTLPRSEAEVSLRVRHPRHRCSSRMRRMQVAHSSSSVGRRPGRWCSSTARPTAARR